MKTYLYFQTIFMLGLAASCGWRGEWDLAFAALAVAIYSFHVWHGIRSDEEAGR